jgi:Tol biopolymer transport system component
LPDGRRLLFTSWGADQSLFLGSLDSKKTYRIFPADSRVIYTPESYLLSVRQGVLFAQKFDADRREVTGKALPVVDSVAFNRNLLEIGVSISQTGLLAYTMAGAYQGSLKWYDRSGNKIGEIEDLYGFDYFDPELSPNDDELLIKRQVQGNYDLYVVDALKGSPRRRLTYNSALDGWGIWSHDGKQIVFDSERDGSPGNLYIMPSNTPDSEKLLLGLTSIRKVPVDWSPDGHYIIYIRFEEDSFLDIWKLPLFGDQKPQLFIGTEYEEGDCQFSPDGRFLAYQSNENGIFEIYVTTFPDKKGKWQISDGGGIEARWGPEGKELFYIAPDGNLVSVPIRTDETTLEKGTPTVLFQSEILGGGNPDVHQRQRYDVTSDGKKFIITTGESSDTPVNFVSNWTRLLKK